MSGVIFSLKCVLIAFAISNLSLIFFCIQEIIYSGLWLQNNPLNSCLFVVNSQFFYCKKLVLNANTKAFWFTHINCLGSQQNSCSKPSSGQPPGGRTRSRSSSSHAARLRPKSLYGAILSETYSETPSKYNTRR